MTYAVESLNPTLAGSVPISSSFLSTDSPALTIVPRAVTAAASTLSYGINLDYTATTTTAHSVVPIPRPGAPPVGPGKLIGIVVGAVFGVGAIFSLGCWQWWRTRIRVKAAKESVNNQIALNSRIS